MKKKTNSGLTAHSVSNSIIIMITFRRYFKHLLKRINILWSNSISNQSPLLSAKVKRGKPQD